MTPDAGSGRNFWLWLALLAGLAVRLIGLDQPLIDHQAWRQTDTAAIARNYWEEGFDLLHPRVDWRGATAGYVETNFPLYPFLVACAYAVLGGPHEWVGRLLSALFSTLAALLLHRLVRRIYPGKSQLATLAAFLYLAVPLNVFFGRAFMPEALMVLLSVASLVTFLRWLQRPGPTPFLLAVTTAALCFLVKIPTLYLGFPLVALAWWKWGWGFLSRPRLWAYAALVLAPPAWWYHHAAGLFEQTGLTFGIWNRYGFDKWSQQALLHPEFYLLMAERFVHRVFTPVGAALALWGLVLGWPLRSWVGAGRERGRTAAPAEEGSSGERSLAWVPYVWLGGLLLYLLMIPEGNRRLHYYQMPFVPVGALFAAMPLASLLQRREPAGTAQRGAPGPLRRRQLLATLACAAVAGYSAWSTLDYYRPGYNVYNYYRSCWEAGRLLADSLPADALLVIGDYDVNAGTPFRSQSPTLLYYCHRKGWQITPDEFSPRVLDSLATMGADFFVAAAGVVGDDAELWRHLQTRGLTFPAALPQLWHSATQYRRAARAHQGADRHLLVVPLGEGKR